MAYQSYLVERFETTHENVFFRELNELFLEEYADKNGDHVFIGNLSVGGHKLDAVFIKSGAIIVLDFKDYEGDLTFSENGPWLIKNKGKTIFVSGGAVSRNPFQQVNAYRFSLFQYLADNESKILEKNQANIKWDHTNGMVVFHHDISIDRNQIAAKIQRYFHISTKALIRSHINDNHSQRMLLTDHNIASILAILSIGKDQQYDASKELQEDSKDRLKWSAINKTRIDQILPAKDDSYSLNVLNYYSTMLGIERFNDVEVSNIVHIGIDWGQVNDSVFTLDLSLYPGFHSDFQKNRMGNFPKHLFVSINVDLNGTIIPLLFNTIMNTEIKNLLEIPIHFNLFDVFTSVLSELEVSENIINEITQAVGEANTYKDKIDAVSKVLDTNLVIQSYISLGLSNEAMYSAQLQSEIKSIIKQTQSQEQLPAVLNSFLNVDAKLPQLVIEKEFRLLTITSLNDAQLEAVSLPFKQPLTIITGPPGTGKSQVVMNIMANALYQNERVLFASKNNKAVDNVYQRLNQVLDTDYFIRVGNAEENRKTVDLLEKLSNVPVQEDKQSIASELKVAEQNFQELLHKITEIEDRLKQITKVAARVENLILQLDEAKVSYQDWLSAVHPVYYKLFIQDKEHISVSNSELNLHINKLHAANGFFGNLFFNLFQKSKVLAYVTALNNKQSHIIAKHIDQESPYFSEEKSIKESLLANLKFIKDLQERQEKLVTAEAKHQITIQRLTESHRHEEELLKELEAEEPALRASLLLLREEGVPLSKSLISKQIALNKASASISAVNGYRGYLTTGIPWKSEEQKACQHTINSFLNHYKAISVSNLAVKKSFLLEKELFDLLIIDEASQSDITSVLPMLYRAKRVVILGDPMQLTHITSVSKDENNYVADRLGISIYDHNYVKESLFLHAEKIAAKHELRPVFLDEHYRCHPEIIQFSNQFFYKEMAGQEMTIKSKAAQYTIGDTGFNWVDVQGKVDEHSNSNKAEIEKCLELGLTLRKKYPGASIGVTTPFKHQKQQLIKAFAPYPDLKIVVDTVHRFQGDEKDIMIFSLVCSQGARSSMNNFINHFAKNLVNVGVTRAKSALYVVGNRNYCSQLIEKNQKTLLAKLADYSKSLNK